MLLVLIKDINRLSTELLPLVLEEECHDVEDAQNELEENWKALKMIGLQNRTLQEGVLNATLA